VDIEAAKKQLQDTLAELDRAAAELSTEQASDDPDISSEDTGDAAVELIGADREQASLEVINAERERVQAALQRIADGTYGHCVDCGRELPEERLEARPEAARCLDDQKKAEAAGAA